MNDPQYGESAVLLTARRFRVEAVQETTADGVLRTREVVRHNGSVAIVPVVDDGHVCLIRNFRIAVGKPLVEIPAGTLEPGEDPQAAAFRELAEETGYQAETMTPLLSCYLSPGILDERMQLFVATGLTVGPAAREPGEQIENLVTTWEEALQQVRQGVIQDAKTIVGLLTYLLTRGLFLIAVCTMLAAPTQGAAERAARKGAARKEGAPAAASAAAKGAFTLTDPDVVQRQETYRTLFEADQFLASLGWIEGEPNITPDLRK